MLHWLQYVILVPKVNDFYNKLHVLLINTRHATHCHPSTFGHKVNSTNMLDAGAGNNLADVLSHINHCLSLWLALAAPPPVCSHEIVTNRTISTAMKSLKQKSKAAASAAVHPPANVALQDGLPLPSIEDEMNNIPIQEAPASRPTTTTIKPGPPRLTNSINPEYLNCSKLTTAHKLPKKMVKTL
jgi:hypothetical protein